MLHVSSRGQKSITTDSPCTNAMAMQAKGRWINNTQESASKSDNVKSILTAIHNMMIKIYPQPTGVDVTWSTGEGISYFGAKQRSSAYTDGRPKYESIELPHFRKFNYGCGFFRYQCEYKKTHSLLPGYPGETGTWVNILANEDQAFGGVPDESWTINGVPVRIWLPVLKTVRGFVVHHSEDMNFRYVLIHRKGILPYIPVTRKQYLEQCIFFHTKLLDESVKRFENLPVRSLEEQEKEKNAKLAKYERDFGKDPRRLKSAVDYYLSGYKTDQQVRDEDVTKAKKIKTDELKKFTDELEKTTQQGLLDSPAMIRVLYNSDLIFETDTLKARMLLVENRDYIRKDLSKYAAQLFVVRWTWNNWAPQKKISEIMEEEFPFEKLLAMIDK